MAYQYRDLLDRTGAVNLVAYEAILAATIVNETNLAMCVKAQLSVPGRCNGAEARRLRAEWAQMLSPLSDEEQAFICQQAAKNLDQLVRDMQSAHFEALSQIAAEDMRV